MKDLVLEKFYRCDHKEILETLYLIYRISSISETFSGLSFKQTFDEMKSFIDKKLRKLKEKTSN